MDRTLVENKQSAHALLKHMQHQMGDLLAKAATVLPPEQQTVLQQLLS